MQLRALWRTGGREPFAIAGGSRSFLEDNDTITLRGKARGEGYTIGFGSCAGKVIPALADPYKRS
jgi:fumarylacetoacetase